MTDLLLDALPTRWAGRRIDPDFRHMVWLANAYVRREPEAEPLRFAREAVARFYAAPEDLLADPARMADAYRHLLEFYLGNDAATPEKKLWQCFCRCGSRLRLPLRCTVHRGSLSTVLRHRPDL